MGDRDGLAPIGCAKRRERACRLPGQTRRSDRMTLISGPRTTDEVDGSRSRHLGAKV